MVGAGKGLQAVQGRIGVDLIAGGDRHVADQRRFDHIAKVQDACDAGWVSGIGQQVVRVHIIVHHLPATVGQMGQNSLLKRIKSLRAKGPQVCRDVGQQGAQAGGVADIPLQVLAAGGMGEAFQSQR